MFNNVRLNLSRIIICKFILKMISVIKAFYIILKIQFLNEKLRFLILSQINYFIIKYIFVKNSFCLPFIKIVLWNKVKNKVWAGTKNNEFVCQLIESH